MPEDHGLSTLVAKRLGWEVVAEFGFQARIGRTLEKSSAAVAFFPPPSIAAATARLHSQLGEKGMGFGAIVETDLSRFILGLLHRLRTMGGVADELAVRPPEGDQLAIELFVWWAKPRPLVARLSGEFFRSLPTRPGVYLMRNVEGVPISFGKAKNLLKVLAAYRVVNPGLMKRRLHLRRWILERS